MDIKLPSIRRQSHGFSSKLLKNSNKLEPCTFKKTLTPSGYNKQLLAIDKEVNQQKFSAVNRDEELKFIELLTNLRCID